MPGRGTNRRTVRIPDSVWNDAKKKAEREGKNLSDVMRRCLEDFLKKNGDKK